MMPELCKIKARCGSVPLSCLGLVWVTSTVRCILQPFHEWVDPWDSIEVYKIKNDSSFLTPNYVALISISGLIYSVLDIIYLFINIHVYTYLHTFKVFTEDLFLMYPCACLYASVYGFVHMGTWVPREFRRERQIPWSWTYRRDADPKCGPVEEQQAH